MPSLSPDPRCKTPRRTDASESQHRQLKPRMRRAGSSDRTTRSIEPGPSVAPTATPSNAAEVAHALELRGIEPSEVEYDTRFDAGDDSEAIVREFLSSHLGLNGGIGRGAAAQERCVKGIVEAFNATYSHEDDFNIELFKAMANCFEAYNGSKFSVEHFPPKKEWKKNPPRFMVITRRRRKVEAKGPGNAAMQKERKERAGRPNRHRPSAASADVAPVATANSSSESNVVKHMARSSFSFCKSKRLKKSDTTQQGSDGGPGDGRDDCAAASAGVREVNRHQTFLAHAQFTTNVVANVTDTVDTGKQDPATDAMEEEKRMASQRQSAPQQVLQRREYALGFAREAHIPVNKYGIVRNASYLDHAVVLFSRDPSQKKTTDKGWSVCQVLATVEIKMENSTCHEFDWMRDKACIKIESSDLAVKQAAPLAQEIFYTFGLVVWSRAALGLELPASLPLAVVAARRERGTGNAKTMRWVYGNLIVPESCGGKFSFNVSSCGKFQGTKPESAAAAYMTVLMEGLESGERWIENMQANMAAPMKLAPAASPPYDEGQDLSLRETDTRPWPRSMCGRRLYFGGSPLEMSSIALVATPASMRKMEVAISQGELYKGRVNLAELRDPLNRWSRNVLWFDASYSQGNVTRLASALEKETTPELPQDKGLGTAQAVIIKVTSRACHRMFLIPDQALLWDLSEERRWSQVVHDILPLLSESLHAVHLTGGFNRNLGLVQILPDLQAARYVPLRPRILDKRLMCSAFRCLIERTLVPLALHRVVHADIRPSFQETANIMCRAQKDHCSMLLIDLDSLMEIKHYKSLPKDKRILSRKNGLLSEGVGTALEFVCLQAVCIAQTWLIGKRMADADGDETALLRLEEELNTETIIKTYLLKHISEGESFDEDRSRFFSIPDSRACSFVLEQVDPILSEFLGQ